VSQKYDVIIIGAGAAGLFCAYNTALQGKRVLVLDHANKVGKKILMSGGGRCNFTNLFTTHEDFTSQNIHFCKSALKQYTPYQFLALVEKYNIEYVEKSAGQLFCKNSSKEILKMLLGECASVSVKIYKRCEIQKIVKEDDFKVESSCGNFEADFLVIATGGLSIPTLGATGFGYDVAKKFGHKIIQTKASLVPFTLSKKHLEKLSAMAGVALKVSVSLRNGEHSIEDDMLFTHRGLSGPAILKLSAYWKHGDEININILPDNDISSIITSEKSKHPDKLLINILSTEIPKKLASYICNGELSSIKLKQITQEHLRTLDKSIHHWKLTPTGTEGYKTAEVTSGGVSTDNVSSKTMESKLETGLYFIGEVLDVTGQLGGYNFQWAWSSAWCAAQSINK